MTRRCLDWDYGQRAIYEITDSLRLRLRSSLEGWQFQTSFGCRLRSSFEYAIIGLCR